MTPVYEKQLTIGPSVCDYSGKVSVADLFAMFMDVATEHADDLKIGLKTLAKDGLFWLTAKTRIQIERRPGISDLVRIATWPEKPQRVRCVRDYVMTRDEEVFVTGKTEWMIMNMKTGRLQNAEEVYPPELSFSDKQVLPEPFLPLDTEVGEEIIGEYTVHSTDIDIGGHMNNVAYIRALMGLMSVEERKQKPVRSLEVLYKAQCFEGNHLEFRRKETDAGVMIHAVLDGGVIAAQMVME